LISVVNTASLSGLSGAMVRVETGLFRQIPGIHITGLASQTIVESRDRIRSAIKQSGFPFPDQKIIINLVPASQKKEGSHFDLPLTIGILSASGVVKISNGERKAFVGELSLDGTLHPVKGALPLVKGLRDGGIQEVFLPGGNLAEASLVPGIRLKAVVHLREVVEFLRKGEEIRDAPYYGDTGRRPAFSLDFQEVRGQEAAKRAIMLAVAGGHHLFMMGHPGSGKTMLAKRIPTIMSPMNREEEMEVTSIYSVAGELKEEEPLLQTRPFRCPHHTITASAMVGGGNVPRPGELSLAHHGVLFLDEFPEFSRRVLEMMRQPLEAGEVALSRNRQRVTYPCRILLVTASNPCPCGHYGDARQECSCRPAQIHQYQSKISGPLLDRIDMQLKIPPVSPEELWEEGSMLRRMSSEEMRTKVCLLEEIQRERYGRERDYRNGSIPPTLIEKFCPMSADARKFLEMAFRTLGLSVRGYHKVIKCARTIADLSEKEVIREEHIGEAIQYRIMDREK
jgi:magnesium chelatase family protein